MPRKLYRDLAYALSGASMNHPDSIEGPVLLVGATGATGRLLLRQLLGRGFEVRAVARTVEKIPADLRTHSNIRVLAGNVLGFTDSELTEAVRGCAAVASCLGHNMSLKGVFGHPRKLVTESVRRLCLAIEASAPTQPVRFVLMNTAGNSNRDLSEKVSFGERLVISLVRHLVPPHSDNEQAADYLRTQRTSDTNIRWVVVRPDTLVDKPEVTPYVAVPSPTRSPIFDAGKTSRINVAHFMAELIHGDRSWAAWEGQMPVVYDSSA
jgi:putative NADH-flavin reductase